MKTKSLLTKMRDVLPSHGLDTLSKRGESYVARRGFFYRNGQTATDLIPKVKKLVEQVTGGKEVADVVLTGEKWVPFKGGSTTAKQSHWYVEFRIYPNTTKVIVKNLQSGRDVEIEQGQVGGVCDPSTNLYHSC